MKKTRSKKSRDTVPLGEFRVTGTQWTIALAEMNPWSLLFGSMS